MKPDIVYPPLKKQGIRRSDVIGFAKWPFLFTAYLCPVLNIVTGGRAWSVIVLLSLWIVWSNVFSIDLIGYNRVSQLIKLITQSCVLLIAIDVLISPGWAIEVVPIVCFSGLIAAGLLFFTDMEKQKQNMMPMLMLCAISLICSVIGLIVWRRESKWAMAVMGAFALALLSGVFMRLGHDFFTNLKKYFHTH